MKKLVLIAALFAPVAQAQFVVHDPVGMAATVAEILNTISALENQLTSINDFRGKIEKVSDLGDIFNDPTLRKYMSEDLQDAYKAFRRSGYEGLIREGLDIYLENQEYDPCKNETVEGIRKNCEGSRAQSSQVYGDSVEALQGLRERSESIEDVLDQLKYSPNLKTTADLNARLQYLQSEQAQFMAKVNIMNNLQEANKELIRDKHRQQTARAFSSRKGLTPELPTFNFD